MPPHDLIVIDEARPHDLAEILALLQANSLPLDGLENHLGTALVARCNGEVVGCAALELHDGDGLLRSVAVGSDRRGLGLGAQLVQSCLFMARQHEVGRVYLLTETAADYFTRFGFQSVERDRVPESLRNTVEFTTACSSEAQVMVLVFVR